MNGQSSSLRYENKNGNKKINNLYTYINIDNK